MALSHYPSLLPDQVEQLLRYCGRSTASGQRDCNFAALSSAGLRGGEVLAMTLGRLDWGTREILVQGKGQRLERLPLPNDVGTALVHYRASFVRRVRRAVCPPACPTPGPSPDLNLLCGSSHP
jgi:integrase